MSVTKKIILICINCLHELRTDAATSESIKYRLRTRLLVSGGIFHQPIQVSNGQKTVLSSRYGKCELNLLNDCYYWKTAL